MGEGSKGGFGALKKNAPFPPSYPLTTQSGTELVAATRKSLLTELSPQALAVTAQLGQTFPGKRLSGRGNDEHRREGG